MLEQTLAPLRIFGQTVPNRIFEDAYLLGYMMAIVAFAIEMFSGGKLSIEDKGRVSIAAFRAVTGINSSTTIERIVELSSAENPEFHEGRRQANRMLNVTYGQIGPKDDPEVQHFFEIAAKTNVDPSSVNAPAAAGALMSQVHFYEVIRKNFRG
jgi:hypothetical protein